MHSPLPPTLEGHQETSILLLALSLGWHVILGMSFFSFSILSCLFSVQAVCWGSSMLQWQRIQEMVCDAEQVCLPEPQLLLNSPSCLHSLFPKAQCCPNSLPTGVTPISCNKSRTRTVLEYFPKNLLSDLLGAEWSLFYVCRVQQPWPRSLFSNVMHRVIYWHEWRDRESEMSTWAIIQPPWLQTCTICSTE